jgi:FdhE protein
MTEIPSFPHRPIPIGEIAAPVFASLPVASKLFHARAERLRWLTRGHELKPYLLLLAGLADIQHRLSDDLPNAPFPPGSAAEAGTGVPPLRGARPVDAATLRPTLDLLTFDALTLDMPDVASAALADVSAASEEDLDTMIRSVLAASIPLEMLAEHSFVAAALQVHFTRLAERLDPDLLARAAGCVCPACGHAPVASMIVGWRGAQGARYCACALCGTLWHYVRVKCTLCASTKGIAYQEIQGAKAVAHAETCTSCDRYMKIIRQDKDPSADPVADDVGSLGLDLLMRDTQFRRGGVNPFLLGY